MISAHKLVRIARHSLTGISGATWVSNLHFSNAISGNQEVQSPLVVLVVLVFVLVGALLSQLHWLR
jgi:hypothetical protein